MQDKLLNYYILNPKYHFLLKNEKNVLKKDKFKKSITNKRNKRI